VLDVLNPKLGLVHNDVFVGRDTGKEQFTQHIEAIGKFQQLENFLFLLDGDARNLENDLKVTAQRFGSNIQPLFLPGSVPEEWAWKILRDHYKDYAPLIGIHPNDLIKQMDAADQIFTNAADKPTSIIKNKYFSFCETIRKPHLELMRQIAKRESEREVSEIKVFIENLETQIRNWQARK